jgi:O-antigen/teichoic acid export membrane protein
MSNLKRIGINMISGGAGYVIPMLLNLLFTPYIIKTLGKEAFGLQVLGNVIIGYLAVADMGLDIPITKKIAEYYAKSQIDHKSKFLVATIKIYFLIGISGMVLVIAFTSKLMALLSIPIEMENEARMVFYMTGFGFLGSIITMWGRAVFNGIQRYDIANAVNIFNSLLGIFLGILLVMKGFGVIGFFLARIIGMVLASVFYVLLASKFVQRFKLFPIIDLEVWHYLKKQIGFGFSLRISGMVFARMDQAIISSILGVAVVAIYSIPILIANALSGLMSSITHFAFPMASAMNATHSHQEMENFFVRISKFITIISTIIFIPLIFVGDKFLALWISSEIAFQSSGVLLILLIAFYLNTCFSTALVAFMVGIGQLKIFTLYGVGRGVILLIGFAILIRIYGLEGAGFSYLLSLILDMFFFFYALKRKLNFNISTLLSRAYFKPLILGPTLGALLIIPLRGYISNWFDLFVLVAGFELMFCLAAWKLNIIDEHEKVIVYKLSDKVKSFVSR